MKSWIEKDKEEYFKNVNLIKGITGKQVGHHVYVHMDVINYYSGAYGITLNSLIDHVINELKLTHEFNVVKLSTKAYEISLLHYPSFYKKFHPALVKSTKIGLESMKFKTQKYVVNRPILHRCETMMIPNSALQAHFCTMTSGENAKGCYDDVKTIGRESAWSDLLKEKGMLEYIINTQNEIAMMIRRMPSLPTTIMPDTQ